MSHTTPTLTQSTSPGVPGGCGDGSWPRRRWRPLTGLITDQAVRSAAPPRRCGQPDRSASAETEALARRRAAGRVSPVSAASAAAARIRPRTRRGRRGEVDWVRVGWCATWERSLLLVGVLVGTSPSMAASGSHDRSRTPGVLRYSWLYAHPPTTAIRPPPSGAVTTRRRPRWPVVTSGGWRPRDSAGRR